MATKKQTEKATNKVFPSIYEIKTLSKEEILQNLNDALKLLAPAIFSLGHCSDMDMDLVKELGLAVNTLSQIEYKIANELRNLE